MIRGVGKLKKIRWIKVKKGEIFIIKKKKKLEDGEKSE